HGNTGTHNEPSPRHEVARVSIINKKNARKKAEEGEVKPKRQVLPPISRIRASLETPVAPSKAIAPAKPQPAPAERPNIIADGTIAPSTEAEVELQKVIHIKPPIIVRQLAIEL